MPKATRDGVKNEVIEYLSRNTYKEKIEEKDDLGEDLGISPSWRKHFAIPLSKIARSYEGGKPIYKYEAEALETVKETIDLTYSRAKGES